MTLKTMMNSRKHFTKYHIYDDGGTLLAKFDALSDAALCWRFLNNAPMSDGQTAKVVQLLDAVDETRERPGD